MKPSISVITPSVRLNGLDILYECLKKQTFKDFEWQIISPESMSGRVSEKYQIPHPDIHYSLFYTASLIEPKKREGDFYNLNKAWNKAFQEARGELIVSIVDQTWIPNDCLEMFWTHYQTNPKRLISGVGDQYAEMLSGRPEIVVWNDPRKRKDMGSFWEVPPIEIEFCCTSVPRQAIIDCKGLKEIYDRGAALSEKEMCARIEKFGYTFWIDSSIEYRSLKHGRLNGEKEWNNHYQIACNLYDKDIKDIIRGNNLHGDL